MSISFSLRETKVGGMVVDVLVRPEIDFERLRDKAVFGELSGHHVPIACIDDLLAMKRAANRGKDRLDIEALEKSSAARTPMPESTRQVIPEAVMLACLEQSEQMREFFAQMWLQNPALAAQAGPRVQELLAPAPLPGAIAQARDSLAP